AEDGIRDRNVTGVQTCALPIYLICAVLTSRWKVRLPGITGTMSVNFFFIMLAIIEMDLQPVLVITCAGTLGQMLWRASKRPQAKIGRASCRERVSILIQTWLLI